MTETRLIDRALIRLSTDDPEEDMREFLQGLVTQDVAAVRADAPQWSALLSAQGKLLFDFLLWADGEDILIDCEASARDSLIKRLKLYRLRRKITIAAEDNLAVHWALDAPDKPHDPRLDALGHRWLEASATDPETGADADWRRHRLSLGVAEGEAELGSEKTLWLECNAAELNGVSFEKGCYVGQENTARMNYRQKINRRIVVVPLEKADTKRQRKAWPELGLSVEHRRIDDLADLDLPDWLQQAL
ncbi:hypothetical protein SAMN02745824_0502 [Parasphingorhabdus marina DSM 22363]|uniref:Aminomethyltransferase folate-binding domain-containing protein n=1 Tax=Parasphingorhabdus marina DSM 22363 TaxID=1123272 RepID=A0A1N6CNM1_9SPHN|nr:folate-binding protein YgfZ [Parasphingorhabdus marina]SIN59964.1 hypothetical protein SAMN02745824_0502 [Parasphingorhabdus marina DSM 22363]